MHYKAEANYKQDIGNGSVVKNDSFISNVHNYSSLYYYEFGRDYHEYGRGWIFDLFLVKVDLFLRIYLDLIIAITAMIGNIIVVYILSKKNNSHFSTSVFMTNLAVADCCLGFFKVGSWLIAHEYLAGAYSDTDCKLRGLIPRACLYMSRWMLAALSIERALCVKIPHKVKSICTVRFARCLVLTLWILAFSKACFYSSMLQFMFYNCYIVLSEDAYLYWVDLCLYVLFSAVIPFTIIIICTIIIILTLARSGIRKSKSNKEQLRSVSVTLLIVNLAFLILVSPAVSFDMYSIIRFTIFKQGWGSQKKLYQYIAIINILAFVGNINNAINFFIYFLSGTKFRKETKELFLSCKNVK